MDQGRAQSSQESHGAEREHVRKASFLAEASRLLANSLEYETTLSTVAALALPHLGAWCIVDIVEESGDIRRLAVVHPDPEKRELAQELQDGWPPTRNDPLGVPAVARSLESEIIAEVHEDVLAEAARSPRNLEILKRLGIGSVMTVPLAARGDVLGAMTFVIAPGGPRFRPHDLELAEDLANRAAIAIDNARLYRSARLSRQAAEMASRAKSQFLGVMSHELRTPINAILGYSQLLDMGVKGTLSQEQRALLNRIEASGQHLLELITHVLDVSRAEAGELTVSNRPTVVDEVISSALQIVTPKAPAGVSIRNLCDDHHQLRFLGDGIRVRQILVHLIDNAFRFSRREGGMVTIRAEAVRDPRPGIAPAGAGPWIRIDVGDTGIGIPEDRIEAVFEPFVQADPATFTRETDGSGLGLAIGRYFARLMGGDLTVRSQPGIGSTFSLWLPAPPDLDEPGRDRRLFDRDVHGLAILAEHLLRRLKPIVDAYVGRLRHDPIAPRTRDASDLELRGHFPHFLAGLANLLAHTGTAGDDVSHVLRGGSAIQRTTLEIHGAQRRALGWSLDAVRLELDLLRRVIHHDVLTTAPEGLEPDGPLDVLDRLFEHAESISVDGWKHADQRQPHLPDDDLPLPDPGAAAATLARQE